MKKNRHSKVKFKDYTQDQLMLIPPSLEDLMDKNHPVHIVNQVLNKIEAGLLSIAHNLSKWECESPLNPYKERKNTSAATGATQERGVYSYPKKFRLKVRAFQLWMWQRKNEMYLSYWWEKKRLSRWFETTSFCGPTRT